MTTFCKIKHPREPEGKFNSDYFCLWKLLHFVYISQQGEEFILEDETISYIRICPSLDCENFPRLTDDEAPIMPWMESFKLCIVILKC